MKLDSKMRLLMTADPVGGVWTYSMGLIEGIISSGIEVVLVTMGGKLTASQRRQLPVDDRLVCIESDFRLEWMNEPWNDVDEAGTFLLGIAKEFSPSLIHLNGFVQAALPWSVPVVLVAHSCVLSWWAAVKRSPRPEKFDEYHRRVEAGLRKANRIIAPSRSMMHSLRQCYGVEFLGEVIWNGCDSSDFGVHSKKAPVIFSAGRLWDECKNIRLLEKIGPLLTWPILIAGESKHPDTCGSSLGKLKGVHILGQLSKKCIARQMGAAAIYVSPAFYEPFGLTVLEAGLSDCALVLSDISTFRELWDGVALFASPNKPEEWVGKINKLIANPDLRTQLGKAARERALQYSRDRMVNGYLRVYGEMMQRSSQKNRRKVPCV